MSELTWVLLPGALLDGVSANSFAGASYSRLVTIVTINADTAPTAWTGATFQLTNDGTLLPQVFTLPKGQNTVRVAVSGTGITVASTKVLTVTCILSGGVQDVNFWIESTVTPSVTADTWAAPTASDIQNAIADPEWDLFTADLLQAKDGDPTTDIMADVVNMIRDAIRSGRRNNLGQSGTIPGGAMWIFKALCKWMLFDRVRSIPGFADKVKDAKKDAEDYLDKVRKGEVEFIAPTIIAETSPSGTWGSEAYVKIDPSEVVTESDTP